MLLEMQNEKGAFWYALRIRVVRVQGDDWNDSPLVEKFRDIEEPTRSGFSVDVYVCMHSKRIQDQREEYMQLTRTRECDFDQ